ncbi:MAG: Uma2 family endonuclease [Lachnospiraceae bacterium]|nr:Uma2 family endonuclease [Lachnospiraceae bacterium]
MDLNLQITDMAGATPEHSAVIVNFVAAIRRQLKNSTCFVYSDNVQYKWISNEGEEKTVIPDASINCQTKKKRGSNFVGIPRFVMEVLSPSTEKYDREEKMELYRQQEIEEYWIVDWRKRIVEIYDLDYEDMIPKYYLWETITEENKETLKIIHFPDIKITFDELFDEIEP